MPEQPERDVQPAPAPDKLPYTSPKLSRWGTLTEITLGGGGKKVEPGGKKKNTRF